MSVTEDTPGRSRRSFIDEFECDAVALVLNEDCKMIDVARSVGVGEGTLENLPRKHCRAHACRAGNILLHALP